MTRWCAFATVLVSAGCADVAPRDEVVVYVAVDRKDAEPILDHFEKESAIAVRAMYDAEAAKTTGLVSRIVAEAERPRCDVFWNNEVAQSVLLAERNLLQPYESTNAVNVPDSRRDKAGRWTGIATRARVIVYNTELVTPKDVPRSLTELTSPRWKGKVAIANPLFGTTRTHIAALYAAWGPERTQEWLRALLANDVRIVDGNAMVKNLVARAQVGASPVLIGLTDTDDVRSGQSQGEPVDLVYPDQDGLGTLVVPTTVCLLKQCPNLKNAKRLVDFLVSDEAETLLSSNESGYIAIRNPPDSPTEPYPRAMDVSYEAIHAQLAPSSDWVSRHFRH